jgi:ADP-heptose:LPS heptosyltransferase
MPLATLVEPFARREDVVLISLQHGPQAADADAFAEIVTWEQRDLCDTAALVAELDIVITVDTLMAHLAGTVGRNTAVLLPFAADWRWMTGRADSPWYPNMRLYRQPSPGDWAPAVAALAATITTAGRPPLHPPRIASARR